MLALNHLELHVLQRPTILVLQTAPGAMTALVVVSRSCLYDEPRDPQDFDKTYGKAHMPYLPQRLCS